MTIDSVKNMKEALCEKLKVSFGSTVEEASDAQMMRASALVLRDVMAERSVDSMRENRAEHRRQVHYLSMEFLMGRSLMKNAFNLGVGEILTEALNELGFRAADVFECEPDAGLGNGGLGRLAACYLDSMTTLDIPTAGYSICYELGIFRQRIVDGQQVELPDNWKDLGGAWLLPKPQETETVRFGGTIRQFWDGGRLHVVPEGATEVLAIPCDMEIAGYGTNHVNTLRLWDAKSPVPLDMSLFSRGEYLRAQEQHAMAETIAKVLYPEDNHPEGKSLRLKQQYFFVSATMQSIVRKHIEVYGTAENFHEKNVIQINDTHPALVIPELMRILMDDAGLDWDTAWHITTHSVAYTNHTVLAEALERWPQELMQSLLPRIWLILTEIARRYQEKIENYYHDPAKTSELAIIWDGQVRMANLCIAGGMAVNGVSALHSDILRNDVFKYQCAMEPEKFKNVTNGIDHRRWLAQINPRLDELVRALAGGDEYLLHPEALKKLESYANDTAVLDRLGEIKRANKLDFAAYVKKTQGVVLNTDAIFDVQVKRLHEYKRQLLNAMHILYLYQQLQNDPGRAMQPRVFLFGAKAAPAGESGFESTYESELGTLHITRTGGFSAVMTGGSRVRSSEKAAEKLLRAMDFQYQTLTREQTETGAVQIRTSQTLLGVPVLGSQLALSYTDDCLTAVEGTFYTGGSSITRVSEQEAISAADALAQLLARRDALGWVGSAVTGLTQAYLPSDQAGTGIRFVPVWLVETDAGSFFINGITREITAET